jgi:hypothetical protein
MVWQAECASLAMQSILQAASRWRLAASGDLRRNKGDEGKPARLKLATFLIIALAIKRIGSGVRIVLSPFGHDVVNSLLPIFQGQFCQIVHDSNLLGFFIDHDMVLRALVSLGAH